jgi:hypothetical protein
MEINMYAKIENENVIQIGLPHSGTLTDGRCVSNYHLLPKEILLAENWLPCEEIKPEYNEVTQILVIDTTQVLEDKVVLVYKAVENQV